MVLSQQGVKYPLDIAVRPGMPKNWKGVQMQYGADCNPRIAGKVYTRWFSTDPDAPASHRNLSSIRAVFKADADWKGYDFQSAFEDWQKTNAERIRQKRLEEDAQRQEQGVLRGERKQAAIKKFRQIHGELNGAVVSKFPGWKTRWHKNKGGQLTTTWIEPSGKEWVLVTDIEALLGQRIFEGRAVQELQKVLTMCRASADRKEHAENRKKALLTGLLEIMAPAGDNPFCLVAAGAPKRIMLRKRFKVYAHWPKELAVQYEEHPMVCADTSACSSKGMVIVTNQVSYTSTQIAWIRQILLNRGFAPPVKLLAVFAGTDAAEWASDTPWSRIFGLYYRKGVALNNRPFFQEISELPHNSPDGFGEGVVRCRPCYLYWHAKRVRWEVGDLQDDHLPWAYTDEPQPFAQLRGVKWQILCRLCQQEKQGAEGSTCADSRTNTRVRRQSKASESKNEKPKRSRNKRACPEAGDLSDDAAAVLKPKPKQRRTKRADHLPSVQPSA
eukprot:CAMPEP_0178384000 /NCGR_PEP_ID=MMETSP0689_2-20121128/7290_1 /TAXON_ID=160604 /ORGANISM="Amphidinium massartii, Strain CS-259" /LENGTH=498 /DNA_ID=CAMNT_0020004235 /DNA_START=16 /DNA_END=1508 /DNA_ORIENTATION=+